MRSLTSRVVCVCAVFLCGWLAGIASGQDVEQVPPPPSQFKSSDIEYEHFFNHGNIKKIKDPSGAGGNGKLENEVIKSKVEVLGEVLKRRVQALRNVPGQKVELVFLVDSSASVGAENFFNELKFVKKLLADFTVSTEAARVAVVTFSSKNRVVRHIDHLTFATADKHKCHLLDQELPAIGYNSGGTYTLGALLEAQAVLGYARPDAVMAIFLVTDGYSNGGDPRPAAKRLREQGVEIFTFGIRNGNVKELFDMASEPQQEHSYIVDSFEEFEALARRALHEDLQTGSYLPQNMTACDRLCKNQTDCCHSQAQCTCGTHTGHYACVCPPGHYGTGLKGDCHPCPGGTYRSEGGPGDLRSCKPCPDEHHISDPASTSVEQCRCQRGYVAEGTTCQLLACPKLEPPRNGYFLKNVCNSVFNGACGIRCNAGYKLVGSSIRLCQENGTWSGEDTSCVMRSCGEIKAPKNGRMNCSQDDYVIDTECQFQCDSGYSLVGSRKRVCLPIGFWDGLPAFCKPVYCNPLPKLINGTLTPASCSQAKSRFGEECNATCQEGFELKGPPVRRCQDNGSWSDEDNKSRCIDVTPPSIACPPNTTVTTLVNENFANVSWEAPKSSDNSGHTPDIISLPAVTELPMKFRIGTSSITYVAQDRRGNKAECTFHVTVSDVESPTVDQCESPPTFLLRDRSVDVTWDEPIFSDNSGKLAVVERSHDPGVFPLGETEIVYTAWDESGNNATCKIVVNVQEHACHMPVDPIHGQANCTQATEAVYCSLTCYDGYAFALPPRQDYFCNYDGQWLPDVNPMPFPDCSVTTHSNTVIQDGILRLDAEPKVCDDPFLMSSMEGQFKRRLAARLNEICGDNMICQVDDLQAECRQVVAEESDADWANSNEIPRSKRSAMESTSEQPLITIRPPKTRTLELRFKVRSRVPAGNITGPGLVETAEGINVTMKELLFAEMNQVRNSLAKSALKGEFDVQFGGRQLNVLGVKFTSDNPQFFCNAGSVPQGEKCVLCPVGTYFNVVSETCESCTQGSYQPNEGQLSCLVCPGNTSTKVVNAKRPEECQAQCLAGTYSASRLEPCTTCPIGTYQPEYFQRECLRCPEGSTTVRRGGRRVEDCRPLCPRGYVSETGLTPVCFPCPMGYYQPQAGQKFCIKCPKHMSTSTNGAASKAECRLPGFLLDAGSGGDLLQNDAVDWTDEFEEPSILEVNECFSLPCHNGGQCQTLEFGFVCKCLPGFSGMQCETNIDECASLPCFNGGTCIDAVNNFTCQCADGFTGHQCETNIDECLSDPCQNGATCVDRVLGYICVCQPGWNGSHCQAEVDECLSDPCQNGATCIDRLANFTCVCPVGWTGFLCEEAVDECLSEPCQNGGTCEDLIGSYYCHCPFGYDGINCQNDIDECASLPCSHGATCVDKVGSFTCMCPPGVIGSTCNISVDSDFSLHFSSSGKLDYVVRESLRDAELQSLTLCTWLNTADRDNYGTPFSYATDEEANALTLTDYSGFVLYINGHKKVTDVTANDGQWHLICITWDSRDGSWQIYADGEMRDQGIGLATNSSISPNGTVILGQEQDSRGGDFSNAESYVGYLYGVELWNYALDDATLTTMTTRCSNLKGNVLTWGDFKHGLRGGIRVEESTFCKGCSEPDPVDYGDVSVSSTGEGQGLATYACRLGYELSVGSASRPCLVYGGWAGPEPQCRRVSCGFPGYILNGLVHGTSYSYGDTVSYNCTRGFKLVGNVSRTCDQSGAWTDEPPECQPMTCNPPDEFADGSILEEQESFAVGEKINFQCNSGFRLEGSATLTCSDQGLWDDALPVCQPLACSYPPNVANGVMTNGIAEIPPEDIPAYLTPGSILTYTCAYGYQLKSTASIICGHDGLWMGEVPRCEAIDCGPPVEVPHSTIQKSGDDNSVGTNVQYTCHEGYEYFGPTVLECTEKGRWLDRNQRATLPVCAPIDCGAVPSLENGEVVAEEMTYASIATVRCFTGYALIGPSNLTCTADRKWNQSDQIRCKPVTCTVEPQPIRNGRPVLTIAAAYQYAQYACDDGFRLSAVDSLQCQPDGTWQGEIPLCLPMECPRPGDIEGGSWKYSGGQVSEDTIFYTGAEITYSCDEGLQMEGESRRICDGSSGWMPRTPLPVCRKQHCAPLENPNRGSVAVEGFEPGQIANYECEQGYQIIGPTERLCTDEGVWSDDDPVCEEIVCDEPTAPPNGESIFTSLSYGSKVLFQCNKGFTLEGAASKTCGDEGQWVGGKGKTACVPRKCERPEIIEHGYISYDVADTGFVTGSSIVYDCEEGYEVIGIRERFCTASGDWTDEEPFCQLIHCSPVPSRLEHGTIIGNDTVYQSVIEFRCNPGYELLGASQVICESEKQWSAPFSVCKPRKCPHPGIVAHSKVTLKQLDNKLSQDVYHFGDVLTFSCLQGYSLSGSRERKCLQDGTWSQKNPSCNRITCPAAPIPVNGFTSRIIPNDLATSPSGSSDENDERVVGAGRTVKFGCKPGFQLRGSTLAKCLDSGQWDAIPPTCYPLKCTPPPKIKHGTHNSTKKREFSVGDEVEYSCDFGFRVKGDPIAQCGASGAWSAQPPTCQRAVCPSRYNLENGTITAVYPEDASSRNVPMSLKFTCKPGFDLVGASIIHCTGTGEWNNAFPTCVPWPCSSPPVPEHGQIVNTIVDAESITVTISCDPGYRLRENAVLTCGSNGQWNGKVECHPQLCPDPGAPPPYIKYVSQPSYRYGDEIHFGCPEGFILNSTSTFMTCGADGQWDGRFGFCTLVRCPMLENPPHGTAKYSGGNSFRSRVTFTCEEGFSIQGTKEAVCLATGRWSVDPLTPICAALSCVDPDPVANAEMVVRGTKVGDTVGYECNQGFHLNGDSERSCLPNGKWSGNDPICDPVFCPVPAHPENGFWDVGGFTPGSTIRFHCHPGFTLIGSPILTCMSDQDWNDQVPTCQQVTCPAPRNPDHGTVNIVKYTSVPIDDSELLSNVIQQQVSYAYRSEAHYLCNEGYQLFGPEKRTCTADGTWSEQSPHCQRIWCPELQPPPHGFVMGTGRQYGDRIRLSCMFGYRLLGEEMSICQASGTWSVTDPQCQALTCDALPHVVHSVVPESPLESWIVGTQLTLQCRPGYTAVGDLSLTCLPNQEWSPVKGKCHRAQCSRPTIKGASVVRIGDSTSSSFHFGDRVAISCNPGRRHRGGSSILTCQSDGSWSGQPPMCESACDGHCLNGGHCSSLPARRCTCPVGYSGDRCQHAHCILPCLYGGTCVAPYRCACRPGRTGPRCEKPLCDPPCMNGGRCISPNTCQCPHGTTGPTCRKRSDPAKG